MLDIFTFQDRKQSLQQVDEFLTKEIAPKELVGDIKVMCSYVQNLLKCFACHIREPYVCFRQDIYFIVTVSLIM